MWTIIDAARRKILRPYKQWQWRRRREPFIFTAARALRFKLYPGEYIDSQIYSEGIYELYLLRFVAANFRGRTMLDVGANIGNHALYLARNFDAVHCFEPNPVALLRLRKNADLSGVELLIHEVGLANANAELAFRSLGTGNLGGSSFDSIDAPVTDILPVRRGDDYLRERDIRDVDFIKIDVEGLEAETLAGLAATIARDRPVIMFEFSGNKSFAPIAATLAGYRYATLARNSLVPLANVDRRYEAIFAIHEDHEAIGLLPR